MKKETKKRIREELRAGQAEYDARTQRLRAAIARYRALAEAERRRASS